MNAPQRLGADPVHLRVSLLFCASLRPIFRAQPSVYSVCSVGTPRFEMSADQRRLAVQNSVFGFCDFCASLWPILRTVFATDYADSADSSLISQHPCYLWLKIPTFWHGHRLIVKSHWRLSASQPYSSNGEAPSLHRDHSGELPDRATFG
jgi:hypothetical protein